MNTIMTQHTTATKNKRNVKHYTKNNNTKHKMSSNSLKSWEYSKINNNYKKNTNSKNNENNENNGSTNHKKQQ